MVRRPLSKLQREARAQGIPALLLAIALLMWTAFGSAQTADTARAEARQHFQQGVELAERGRYQEALSEFQSAHRLTDNYAVLYNIGQSHIALGDSLAALIALEQYLESGKGQLAVERTQQVELQLTALRAELGELQVHSSSAGSELRVDGQAAGTLPLSKPLFVLPGQHELELSTVEGSTRRTVVLSAGDRMEVNLEPPGPVVLQPVASSAEVQPPEPPTATPPASPATSPHRKTRTAGYVTAGVGLGAAVATLTVFVWNLARYERWQSEHQALAGQEGSEDYVERQTKNNELAQSIDTASAVTVGLAVGSGVLVASGVTLVVLSGRSASKPGPEPTGFLLSYRAVW